MKTTPIIAILAISSIVLPVIGCSKLLEVPANASGQVTTAQVFTDSADATQGILGLYTGLVTSQYPDLFSALTGDEVVPTSRGISTELYKDSMFAGSPTSASTSSLLWDFLYSSDGIYLANAGLEGISGDSLLSPVYRNQLIGECKVFRAYYNFYLVNFYGPIPLITSTDFRSNRLLPRSPIDSVYARIIADLRDAMSKLRPAYPTKGRQRANRYMAAALLARVYLYTGRWAEAQAMADQVIGSGLYSLVTDLNNVFLEGSPEAILQISNNDPAHMKVAPGHSPFQPYLPGASPPNFSVSSTLLNAFDSGDQRKLRWIGSETVGGISYNYSSKYKNTDNSNPGGTTEDLMVLRLSEMYLIRAEAKARLGDLAGAMQDVGIIRSRAGLTTPVTAADLPGAIGVILHERQSEFFCEMAHRWMDLKRCDSLDIFMKREKPEYWPADGHTQLYPIPYRELLSNPNLTQNAGY